MLHQQASHGEGDPAPLVGRYAPGPEGVRDDAEHRAAVEALEAAFEGVAAETADLERASEGHGDNLPVLRQAGMAVSLGSRSDGIAVRRRFRRAARRA